MQTRGRVVLSVPQPAATSWKKASGANIYFDGPTLAAAPTARGTLHAWLHPEATNVLHGLHGGNQEIPSEWGLANDQRNARVGVWVDALLALAGVVLLFWKP